jgi:hypothetical protein
LKSKEIKASDQVTSIRNTFNLGKPQLNPYAPNFLVTKLHPTALGRNAMRERSHDSIESAFKLKVIS